jgi:hypothetical protein
MSATGSIFDLFFLLVGLFLGVYFASLCGVGTIHVAFIPKTYVYFGELRHGKMNGYGSKYDWDGGSYIGQWKNGSYHGDGKLTYPDGGVFSGNFENGLRSGFGVLKYPNGTKYAVKWRDDKKEGEGVFIDHTGRRWVGVFEDDRLTDKGRFEAPAEEPSADSERLSVELPPCLKRKLAKHITELIQNATKDRR